MENTSGIRGNYYLARAEFRIETYVVHARGLKIITESDKKTDKNDVLFIARMLRLWKKGDVELQMAFMPTEEQCELKDLCRCRGENLRILRNGTKNQ